MTQEKEERSRAQVAKAMYDVLGLSGYEGEDRRELTKTDMLKLYSEAGLDPIALRNNGLINFTRDRGDHNVFLYSVDRVTKASEILDTEIGDGSPARSGAGMGRS
jgi:hypothetical protein